MQRKILHIVTISGVAAIIGAIAYTGRVYTAERSDKLASTPTDFSWKSWRRALLETKNAFGNKNLSSYAAGVAYFGTLAFFPLVAAIVAIAGLTLKPQQLSDAFRSLSTYLPHDVAALFTQQLQTAVGHHASSLLVVIVGIVLSIWAVAGAMQNNMSALNVAYGVKETRGFIRLKLVSLALTAGMIVGGMLLAASFVSGSSMLKDAGLPSLFVDTFSWLRWLIMLLAAMIGLAIVYRYAPNRRPLRRWQWVSWGAIIGTILWIGVSAVFFVYLQYFANFSKSYSTFAGIIGLMMWLNFSAQVMLLGAEVNHRLEKQTLLPTGDD